MNAASARRLGTMAGILVVISIFAGGFAEVYVPGKLLVATDPIASSRNLAESAVMFRCSFAVYLVEAICDIALALVLYELLKPVSRSLSLLAAFFGLVSTSTFAFSELFYFLASVPILDGDVRGHLGPEQQSLFTFIALTLYGYGGGLFMVFYGIATMFRGWLICRSDYLPGWLGILLLVAGAGFVLKNFVFVLVPMYDSGYLLAPMFLAMIALAGWFLVKGIDAAHWPASGSGQEVS